MNIKPMTIIFIGAIIAIFGGLLTAYGTYMQNKMSLSRMQSIQGQGEKQIEEIGNLKTQNILLQSTVDSLNKKANEQVNTIIELSKQNADLSIQLSKSTKTLYDNLTGGDSFCEMQIQPINSDSGRIIIIHHGNSTLYDVAAKITDLTIYREVKDNKFKKAQTDMIYGNINPNTGGPIGTLKSNFSSALKEFNVQFSARNGSFVQQLKIFNKDGKWVYATRIKTLQGDKVLLEEIEPDFPKEILNWK